MKTTKNQLQYLNNTKKFHKKRKRKNKRKKKISSRKKMHHRTSTRAESTWRNVASWQRRVAVIWKVFDARTEMTSRTRWRHVNSVDTGVGSASLGAENHQRTRPCAMTGSNGCGCFRGPTASSAAPTRSDSRAVKVSRRRSLESRASTTPTRAIRTQSYCK